jgi:CubicO group peptidase (beta-lactamase class C family)
VTYPHKFALFIASAFLLASIAPTAAAQSFDSQANGYITQLANKNQFRGNVLVARNGKILFEKSYGNAIESWNVPNSTSTKFELASLTKQFTGAAILQLAQSGKLNIDDRISKYYKPSPAAWAGITIRQLANHTSGIPNNDLKDYPKGIMVPYTPEELIATFKDRPLAFPPGTKWAYTNTEYYLLAYIIETVSGQTYAAYLQKNIFHPLGMKDSGFASTLAVLPQMAEGYAKDGDAKEGSAVRHRDYYDRSLEIGAGGVYSTTHDLLLWDRALSSDKFLNENSLESMFTPSQPGNYGFGWFIEKGPRTKDWHEGGDPGFSAFEIHYPDDGIFIIVLSNLEDSPVRQIANQLANLVPTAKTADAPK